jgi:hypothetical protein
MSEFNFKEYVNPDLITEDEVYLHDVDLGMKHNGGDISLYILLQA